MISRLKTSLDCLIPSDCHVSQRSSLTNVVVVRFAVKVLVDPVLLHLEDLLAAGVLLTKRSPQNHLQFFHFDRVTGKNWASDKNKRKINIHAEKVDVLAPCAPVRDSLEAVRGGQHPARVDQDSAALVVVLPVSRLVHVDESLPRLLRDVALPAPRHAVHGPI